MSKSLSIKFENRSNWQEKRKPLRRDYFDTKTRTRIGGRRTMEGAKI